MPAAVVLLVFTLIVELPEPVTVVGAKLALAPEGNPFTLSETPAVKQFWAVTVALKLAPPPTITVCEDGDAVSPKSLAAGFTTRLTAAL